MAYLDLSDVFSQLAAVPVQAPQDFLPTPEEAASFQRTEWTVISLARLDGVATLHEPRRSRLGRILLGRPRSYMLSGERLEALRRLAVEAWHRPLAISLPTLGAFIAAGFSSAQLSLLLATTGALRAMAGQNASPDAAPRNFA